MLEAPITLVSFEYDINESQLPDVHKFFRVMIEANTISSATFTEDHVGYHRLKVTIADNEGS